MSEIRETERRARGGVIAPTFDELRAIAKSNHFSLTDEECQFFYNCIVGNLEAYSRVQQLPDDLVALEIKYPRLPGRRPTPKENPHNAWYWKTAIKGANQGMLAGKKVALKDSVGVYGVPNMVGSGVLDGGMGDEDATVVTWMLDQGVEIAGKATCEDLCIGCSVTAAPALVTNPYNPEYGAGGSSSGSAALVALGEVDFALGCDQGGSIRIPAALCGVVGLKPTCGLVPYTGIGSIDPSLDHCGPMARTCRDAALLLSVIAGYDQKDPRQKVHVEKKDYTKMLTGDLKGLKIGIVKEGFDWESTSAKSDKIVLEAVQALTTLGAIVEEVSVPYHRDAGKIYTPILLEGAANHMFRMNGVGVGHKGHYSTNAGTFFGRSKIARGDNYSHLAKLFILNGTYMYEKYQGQYYAKAQNLATWMTTEYDNVLENYDVLVMPTTAPVGSALPLKNKNIDDYVNESFRYHQNCAPFDMTGHPALSVPAGKLNGLPVGMMLIGRHFEDGTLLRVGDAYEKLGRFEMLVKNTLNSVPIAEDHHHEKEKATSGKKRGRGAKEDSHQLPTPSQKKIKTNPTLEERLQKMEDIEEIRKLKWSYAKHCDNQYNPKELANLFTEDAVWDGEASGFGIHKGKQAIHDFFAGVASGIPWTLHPIHNPLIDIHSDGINAHGSWTIIQPMTSKDEGNKLSPKWLMATYEDDYKKVDGVWKIHRCLVKIDKFVNHLDGW
jgi:amidase